MAVAKNKMCEKLSLFNDATYSTFAVAIVESTVFYLPKKIVRHMKCPYEAFVDQPFQSKFEYTIRGKHVFIVQGALVNDFSKIVQYLTLYGDKKISVFDFMFLSSLSTDEFVRIACIQRELIIKRMASCMTAYLVALRESEDEERNKQYNEIMSHKDFK